MGHLQILVGTFYDSAQQGVVTHNQSRKGHTKSSSGLGPLEGPRPLNTFGPGWVLIGTFRKGLSKDVKQIFAGFDWKILGVHRFFWEFVV